MLIANLICGILEPNLKFKTPVSIYYSRIYLQLTLLKVVCLCYCELYLLLKNQIIVSLLLKVFVYVMSLIPSIAAKIFSKLHSFACAFREILFDI